MEIKRKGNIVAVSFTADRRSINRGIGILTIWRTDANVRETVTYYTGRTHRQIRNYQRVANRFTAEMLDERKEATIIIVLPDVTEFELARTVTNIKQAYELYNHKGQILDIQKKRISYR